MPSPFPGMDPYLESQPFWSPLHSGLITGLQQDLKKRVPRNYSVWTDLYIWLHEPDAEERSQPYEPDVFVAENPTELSGGVALAAIDAPATTLLPAVKRKSTRFLKIMEARSDRVITVIELLSPSNKAPGDNRDAYLAKRNEYLATGTNLVEIDLLRRGRRMPLGEPAPCVADYYVLVCRAAEFPKTAIWPIKVRDRLPEIAIPLKPEDGCVLLPLQPCLDWAYDIGPYDNEVDYLQPPTIPLQGDDAAWAEQVVKARKVIS
jgi:Protein of unknown function (DUF4058)